jgi:Brp/Blh family beta-carotene 15,15'-monooxygenase
MNSIRIQGKLFSAIAILISVLSLLRIRMDLRLDQQIELLVLAILIIVLGVPHGALDTIFARQLYGVRTAKGWIGFIVLYVVLAALVVGLWFVAPFLFLAGFLAISMVHFSGDLADGTSIALRVFYGGAIIVLPTLLHAEEVTQIFSFLVNRNSAELMVSMLHLLSWPWIAALILFGSDQIHKNALVSLEAACVALLAVTAPPLIAFTAYFCSMHSARHIMRTFYYSERSSAHIMIIAAIGPMAAVMLLSVGASIVFSNTPLDARLIQIVFIGLAALTVPHMALVEQVRMSGWTKGATFIRVRGEGKAPLGAGSQAEIDRKKSQKQFKSLIDI